MKEALTVTIESLHLPDKGDTENALELPPEILVQREVVMVDIANDQVPEGDYYHSEDPAHFHSTVTGCGPLKGDWIAHVSSIIHICYSIIDFDFI